MSIVLGFIKALGLTVLEIALLPVWMTMEIVLIHAFMGWNKYNAEQHLSGLVGGISIGAIFMVYCYQNNRVVGLFKNRPFWFNIILFNLINFPLAFFFYFSDYYFIKFIANGADQSVGVVLHQCLIFWVGGILGTWCARFGKDYSATAKGIFEYFLSWAVWAVFGYPTMRGTSFTVETTYENTWTIFSSLCNTFTFTNLMKLSIFRFMDFEKIGKNGFDAFMLVGLVVIMMAAVEYGIIYWITYLYYVDSGKFPNISQTTLTNTVANYISCSWVGVNVASRWFSPWLWFNWFGNKGYGSLAIYTIICWIIGGIISWINAYIYLYFIVDIVFKKWLGIYAWMGSNEMNNMDFIWGFGMGNLTLVYNGVQFFSAKGWAWNPKPEDKQ